MADDFTKQLINAILASRTEKAPPPGHPAVIGGHPFGTKRQTKIEGGVDIGAIFDTIERIRFGGKKPEVWNELGNKMYQALLSMDPESQKAMINDPINQRLMERAHQAGNPYFIQQDGKFVPAQPTPEAKARAIYGGANESTLMGGFFGEEPRRKYIESVKETRTPTQAEALERIYPGYHREKLELEKQEVRTKQEEAQALTTLRNAQANYYNAAAKVALTQDKGDDSIRKERARQLGQNFHEFVKEMNNPNVKITDYERTKNLHGVALAHVQTMTRLTGDPLYAMDAPIIYYNQASSFLRRPPLAGGWFKAPPAEEVSKVKSIIKDHLDFANLTAKYVPPSVNAMAMQNIMAGFERLTTASPDRETIDLLAAAIKLGRALGYDTSELEKKYNDWAGKAR